MSNDEILAKVFRGTNQPCIIVEKRREVWPNIAQIIYNSLGVGPGDRVLFVSQSGVAELRKIVSEFSVKPVSGKARALIIFGADELSKEESNTLLKILEEPPSYGRIILLTRNFSKILATVRSRCGQLVLPSEAVLETKEDMFKKKDFNDFLRSVKGLENEEILDILENTLINAKKHLASREELEFYKDVALSYIKAQNTNVNRKLILEKLFLDKKAKDTA